VVLRDRTLVLYDYVVSEPEEARKLIENLGHHPRRERALARAK
jgi:hypothetical protein